MAKQRGFRPSTFFGYQERDKEDRFNWAEVGTKAADIIETEAAEREQKKEEYKQQNDIFEKLRGEAGKATTSNNASLNNQIVATTQRAVDKYYEFYKKFTNGEISESDWVQYRTNIMDGLNNYFGIMSDYSEQYQDKMTRLQEGKSTLLEQSQMKQLEGFNNYSQWQTEVGGDGRMYIGKIDKDGNPVLGSGNIFHMEEIRHNVNQKDDVFDVNGAVNTIEQSIGDFTDAIRKGKIATVSDKKRRDDYVKVRDSKIQQYISNPYNVASILTDTIGGYNIVYDENEAGGNNIYVEVDPETKLQTPKPTDDQIDEAREYMEVLVDGKTKRIETMYTPPQRPKWMSDKSDRKKLEAYLYDAIARFRANPTKEGLQDVQGASNQIGGGKIIIDDDNMIIVDKDGKQMGAALDLFRAAALEGHNAMFTMLGGSPKYLEENKNRLKPTKYEGIHFKHTVSFQKAPSEMTDDELLKRQEELAKAMGSDSKAGLKNQQIQDLIDELEKRKSASPDEVAFKEGIDALKNLLNAATEKLKSSTKKKKTTPISTGK